MVELHGTTRSLTSATPSNLRVYWDSEHEWFLAVEYHTSVDQVWKSADGKVWTRTTDPVASGFGIKGYNVGDANPQDPSGNMVISMYAKIQEAAGSAGATTMVAPVQGTVIDDHHSGIDSPNAHYIAGGWTHEWQDPIIAVPADDLTITPRAIANNSVKSLRFRIHSPCWPTFSGPSSPFIVRDLEYIYTGPVFSWPMLLRINPLAQPSLPQGYRKDVFEYFDPTDGSTPVNETTPLMYTQWSDLATPAPAPYSMRQVAQIEGAFNYFPQTPFDNWQNSSTVRSYGISAPASIGLTTRVVGIFQFAYDTDLTNIQAQWQVTIQWTRTAP